MATELCHFPASQTEGGGGSGSGGSGSLCTNSMGKFNFLMLIDKKCTFLLILYVLP